ncbi:MAG: hypothetical protein ACHQC8_02275 [Solirubrobacterales bacterium]
MRGLQTLSLGLSSFEARGPLVGPIDAIAAALYRPDRHPIRREEWSSYFRGKAHGTLIGRGEVMVEPGSLHIYLSLPMRLLLNIIWFVLAGLWIAIGYTFVAMICFF